MEIPLDLERRFERRWIARFFSTKRIGLKGCINRMPRPTKEECPLGLPLVITGEQWLGPRQEVENSLNLLDQRPRRDRLGEIGEAFWQFPFNSTVPSRTWKYGAQPVMAIRS